jgi:hypothetical protein
MLTDPDGQSDLFDKPVRNAADAHRRKFRMTVPVSPALSQRRIGR